MEEGEPGVWGRVVTPEPGHGSQSLRFMHFPERIGGREVPRQVFKPQARRDTTLPVHDFR